MQAAAAATPAAAATRVAEVVTRVAAAATRAVEVATRVAVAATRVVEVVTRVEVAATRVAEVVTTGGGGGDSGGGGGSDFVIVGARASVPAAAIRSSGVAEVRALLQPDPSALQIMVAAALQTAAAASRTAGATTAPLSIRAEASRTTAAVAVPCCMAAAAHTESATSHKTRSPAASLEMAVDEKAFSLRVTRFPRTPRGSSRTIRFRLRSRPR